MEETVDDVAEKEFHFWFKQPDSGGIHEIFEALRDFGGSIKLVSSKGVVWTPKDSENLLRRYFSDPNVMHTARAKTEKELKLYKSVFENFPDYVGYE